MVDAIALELEAWLVERLRVAEAYEALAIERERLAEERDRLAGERDRLLAERFKDLPDEQLDQLAEIVVAARRDRELAAEDRRAATRDRVRAASDLEATIDALRRMDRELRLEKATAEDLRHADELKDVFLLALSHDLRSPLSVIVGFSELINERLEDLSPDQIREGVRRIASGGQHMGVVLDNLLDMERLQGGMLEPKAVPADVAQLIQGCVRRLDLDGRTVDVFPDSFVGTVDPGLVERIADNLLLNAARHTPPGSSISVTISREKGDVLLTFADDGTGVPDDMKDAIFQAFKRGQRSDDGLGVGLYLVKRFAELHGGRVWVQDRPGGGAAFCVILGDVDAPDEDLEAMLAPPPPTAARPTAARPTAASPAPAPPPEASERPPGAVGEPGG